MRSPLLALLCLGAVAAACGAPAAPDQSAAVAPVPPAPAAEINAWTPPRTAWGHPDLQGIWSPGYTLTPLERPPRFDGREYLTDAEVAELEGAQEASPGRDFRPEGGTVADVEGAYNDAFTGRGDRVIWTRRTSMIVDPPDGRMPPLTADARARGVRDGRRGGAPLATTAEGDPIPYFVDAGSSENTDNPEDRPSDRCLGVTLPFVRVSTGTFSRIVQSPSAVTIYQEYGHHGGAYRTIHLDGRPHPPAHVRQWLGHSTGHWEGDTLVVDVTNFTSRTSFRGSRDNLHLVERFTRVGPDRLIHRVTVDDPTVWTRPWTIELPLAEEDNRRNQIYEAACHEGNYALTNILAGARRLERLGSR